MYIVSLCILAYSLHLRALKIIKFIQLFSIVCPLRQIARRLLHKCRRKCFKCPEHHFFPTQPQIFSCHVIFFCCFFACSDYGLPGGPEGSLTATFMSRAPKNIPNHNILNHLHPFHPLAKTRTPLTRLLHQSCRQSSDI